MRIRFAGFVAFLMLAGVAGVSRAQNSTATTTSTAAPPAQTSSQPEASAPPTAPADQTVAPANAAAPADQAGTPAAPAPAVAAKAPNTAKPQTKPAEPTKTLGIFSKKEKEVYTGPTEIITLTPTPMLDEEGKQRVDPEGKLMFNPPVKQQRDKKGHPLFDDNKKPVFQTATELGYDEQGHHLKTEKIKPPKMTPVSISRGTFTVDGVVGKAGLNYEIADLKYIYLYVPGQGVTVVSNQSFPGAKRYPDAFNGTTLTVKSDEHTLQIASDQPLLKDKKPQEAFVSVDRDFRLPSRYPVVGWGEVLKPPYNWPNSRPNGTLAHATIAPPVPVNLRPTIMLQPCAKGEMRMPAPPVLPGQVAPEQPCVPIAQAQAAQAAMRAKAAASTTPAPIAATPAPAATPAN